jgi:hypothetical protein
LPVFISGHATAAGLLQVFVLAVQRAGNTEKSRVPVEEEKAVFF